MLLYVRSGSNLFHKAYIRLESQRQTAEWGNLKRTGLRQILRITGLRRTGKTTLLFQLISQKICCGLCPNAKFLISGSSSLFIRKRVQESLAGRIFQFVLHPLAFSEYLVFTDEVEDGEVIPVEVKYKDRLLQKDLRNLRAFCRKFGVKRARVYMKTPESTRLDSLGADVLIEGIPAFSM